MLVACLSLASPAGASGQHPGPEADPPPDSIRPDTVAVDAPPAARPGWRFVHVNELETPFTTIQVGGGVLADYATYVQDDASREQFALEHDMVFRDTRFIVRGRLQTKRPVTWQAGLMYDTNNGEWKIRQTGIVMAVPEILGNLWIGRSKEGMSLNRVMVGYDGWTMERFPFSESIPLLADGVKWLGHHPERELVWNLGVFTDWLSEGEGFSYYRRHVAGRLAWVRIDPDTTANLVHIGVSARVGLPAADSLQLRARPEVGHAPYFVDTGKFRSTLAGEVGVEAYYRPGPWLVGTEYFVEGARFGGGGAPPGTEEPSVPLDHLGPSAATLLRSVASIASVASVAQEEPDDPDRVWFHGGDAFVSRVLTGETRGYATPGGHFTDVVPARSAFAGGPGAWEGVLRLSYVDLNSGTVRGGSFWRLTPTLNWYLSENVRLGLAYGYGALDRFGVTGRTHFFQTRVQMQL